MKATIIISLTITTTLAFIVLTIRKIHDILTQTVNPYAELHKPMQTIHLTLILTILTLLLALQTILLTQTLQHKQ